jgi:hypothetical protein
MAPCVCTHQMADLLALLDAEDNSVVYGGGRAVLSLEGGEPGVTVHTLLSETQALPAGGYLDRAAAAAAPPVMAGARGRHPRPAEGGNPVPRTLTRPRGRCRQGGRVGSPSRPSGGPACRRRGTPLQGPSRASESRSESPGDGPRAPGLGLRTQGRAVDGPGPTLRVKECR